jgi:thioredoxin reductase (NADPH)
VTLVHRREEFRASRIMLDRARANPKIAWRLNEVVQEIHGEGGMVVGVTLRSTLDQKLTKLPAGGVFVAIGHKPNTDIFRGKLDMNDVGYLKIQHPSTRTSVEGVFAAGDVADPTYRQAVSAAGEGCKAAMDAERWLASKGIH